MNLAAKAILLAIFALHSIYASISDAQTKKEVLVGAPLSLSGYASVHGNNMRDGIELAREELIKKGMPVSVVYEDDATMAAKTVSAVSSMQARGITFFMGPTWCSLVESSVPVLEQSGLVAFSPACSSKTVGKPTRSVFFASVPPETKGKALENWIREKGLKRVAILVANDPWCVIHAEVIRKAATSAGAEVVFDDHFDYGYEAASIPTLVTKLSHTKPDLVVSTSSGQAVGLMLKDMQRQKLSAPLLTFDEARDAVEQGFLDPKKTENEIYSLSIPVSEGFREKFRKKYNREPGVYSDSAYDGLSLIVRAIYATDGSAVAVKKFLRESKELEGTRGLYSFDENGDVTISQELKVERVK